MAKIISVPDVHGTHQWETVKNIPTESYDYIVFHGDYFDSWENDWPDQGENFKEICNFVREDKEHRKMLIGNHDWSYLTRTKTGSCSGHQNARGREIKKLLQENLDIIDLAFECDGWIFSHAGFSATWVDSIKKVFHQILDKWPEDENTNQSSLCWNENEFCIDFLNKMWHKLEQSENNVNIDFDEHLDWYGFFSGSGDEVTQGPLWIRPDSLLKDAYFKKQVVGHTEICLYENVFLKRKENYVVFVDSPLHNVFDIFDTNVNYDFITTEEFLKIRKKTLKVINNIKSQIIYCDDTESFIKDSLKKSFSEKVAEQILKIAFKDYLE